MPEKKPPHPSKPVDPARGTGVLFFPIRRLARQRLGLGPDRFDAAGRLVLADQMALQRFSQAVIRCSALDAPGVGAGLINASGLIYEIMLYLFERYGEGVHSAWFQALDEEIGGRVGPGRLDAAARAFDREFRGPVSPGPEVVWQDRLLIAQANENPALLPLKPLIEDRGLRRLFDHARIQAEAEGFFATWPGLDPEGPDLLRMLRGPAQASPHSLRGQLVHIRDHWSRWIGPFRDRLLRALDLLAEEEKERSGGPGAPGIAEFGDQPWLRDHPRFSSDADWMPRLVLLAKNTHVWLNQLSRIHQRPISTLDQIPNEELDTLARRGFSGLWLIGLWERSPASARIKQICGNPEAMASAYAVYEYRIARDLGGETALEDLRARALQRGIRLASDMVPNHMGLDSPWVTDTPDHFIQLDTPPYPGYRFSGPDLSDHPGVALHLEDHYYDRSDAAVVFQWTDRRSGEKRYIYHGNDGTSMPWNDTAQLNHLLPEVRQRLLDTIVDVARRFPIIRFDAAMTLTRFHYRRLWFPRPGEGGDIPTRSQTGMESDEFDRRMPDEFWRQVVDRVASEAPDTLLLAEAFWLMESYFVRNLGMHRVYNSAFMNFLRDENNRQFRESLRKILAFNPAILGRYVNFMNNPDEETAVAQFGKGDKYFGICTLLATLPGLPMFGHGQVEGLEEKYGMEYRRAYRDERGDPDLVDRHERQIFPLLRRRHLFSGVDRFQLYDVVDGDGKVCEDVLAYSNRSGECTALVVYHNRFATCRGRIRSSVPRLPAGSAEGHSPTVEQDLVTSLGLDPVRHGFMRFRDLCTGLEHLRDARELTDRGWWFELAAYQAHVFVDFTGIEDTPSGIYAGLCVSLNGHGVPDLDEVLRKHYRNPLFDPWTGLLRTAAETRDIDRLTARFRDLLAAVRSLTGWEGDMEHECGRFADHLGRLLGTPSFHDPRPRDESPDISADMPGRLGFVCLAVAGLDPGTWRNGWDMVVHWALEPPVCEFLGRDGGGCPGNLLLLEILTRFFDWEAAVVSAGSDWVSRFLRHPAVGRYLRVHDADGETWFHRESAENLLAWLFESARLRSRPAGRTELGRRLHRKWLEAIPASGFRVAELERIWTRAVDTVMKRRGKKEGK